MLNMSSTIEIKNKNLWEAFINRQQDLFILLLENGSDPGQVVDAITQMSTFEIICSEPDASDYLALSMKYSNADPNKANPYNGKHPIHIAAWNLAIDNIIVLLNADPYCANQTLNSNKTPLHLVAEVMNDENLYKVVEIIHIFSEFGGDFSWPARKSGNQTPFLMILEKLATVEDTDTSVKIIKYLILRYPQVDKFQRSKCARLMHYYFEELTEEYQVVKKWREPDSIPLQLELVKLITSNEAEFLVTFDNLKVNNLEKLKNTVVKKELLVLAIQYDKFESFVEIFNMQFTALIPNEIALIILRCKRYRIFKYFLNHDSIKSANPKWMICILSQVNGTCFDSNSQKCFQILLNHPKYEVDKRIPQCNNMTAVHYAAKNGYAVKEFLKKGASLVIPDNDGAMAIQCIDKNAFRCFLDSCIRMPEGQRGANDLYMVIDYSFLKASKEMPIINYLADNNELQSLIVHPVISSFLFLKWSRLNFFFHMSLLFYTICMFAFLGFLVIYYVDKSNTSVSFDPILTICRSLGIGLFMMCAGKEIFKFTLSAKNYLTCAENYLELSLIWVMGFVLFSGESIDHDARLSLAAYLILGFAIEWTLNLITMFDIFTHIVLLKRVACNFMRILCFYSFVLFVCTFSFHTVTINQTLKEKDKFLVFLSLMLTGDFEIMREKMKDCPVASVFFCAFVLSMTFIMINLLVSLTVYDTTSIQNEAEWHKWCERAKLLRKYEQILWNCAKWLKYGWWKNSSIRNNVQLMPDFLPLNRIKVNINLSDNDNRVFIQRSKILFVDESDFFAINIEYDPFPLCPQEDKLLNRNLSCYNIMLPVKMDKFIIAQGLSVLERNKESKLKSENVTNEKHRCKEINWKIYEIYSN